MIFKKTYTHFLTKPHIYYYNDDDQELPFPGEKMSPDGGNNRYVYTIYGVNNPRVILIITLLILQPDNNIPVSINPELK